MKLFNSLTQTKEEFNSKGEVVSMYTCGITPYRMAHIGNLRTYIFEDVLKRTLIYDGCQVKHIQNITDIGDVLEDGSDKVALDTNIAHFIRDLSKLDILLPDKFCWASDYIPEQINLINSLPTYKTDSGIYLDLSQITDYGILGGLNKRKDFVSRISKNNKDFVLWRKRDSGWECQGTTGIPGWHIECSAIAKKELGNPITIHCGGVDHLTIHHNNEIAQGTIANYWLHGEFLMVNGNKMSKSLGNVILLEEINPRAFRYLCLTAHYRSLLNFTDKSINDAKITVDKLFSTIGKMSEQLGDGLQNHLDGCNSHSYLQRFNDAINDDLGTPRAIAIMWEMLKSDLPNSDKLRLFSEFNKIFGL